MICHPIFSSHFKSLMYCDYHDYISQCIINGREKYIMYSLYSDGTLVEGTDNILKHATTQYRDLFGPAPRNLFAISPDLWNEDERINESDNMSLLDLFLRKKLSMLCLLWRIIKLMVLIQLRKILCICALAFLLIKVLV